MTRAAPEIADIRAFKLPLLRIGLCLVGLGIVGNFVAALQIVNAVVADDAPSWLVIAALRISIVLIFVGGPLVAFQLLRKFAFPQGDE